MSCLGCSLDQSRALQKKTQVIVVTDKIEKVALMAFIRSENYSH